jgi:hypothetical protein
VRGLSSPIRTLDIEIRRRSLIYRARYAAGHDEERSDAAVR